MENTGFNLRIHIYRTVTIVMNVNPENMMSRLIAASLQVLFVLKMGQYNWQQTNLGDISVPGHPAL